MKKEFFRMAKACEPGHWLCVPQRRAVRWLLGTTPWFKSKVILFLKVQLHPSRNYHISCRPWEEAITPISSKPFHSRCKHSRWNPGCPLTSFTKTWRLVSNGTIPWPCGSELVWNGGYQFTTTVLVSAQARKFACNVEKVEAKERSQGDYC
ncbi:hypothetical protein C5167_007305 [Papaver somniferum]|uniref:uncharacterized protein LOC113344302 isoform X2 n=1 Tax=Papaver somniferum TaxID=3469 RepID=UPI000E6F47B8|nr:uncharacterized protein LOC113344302 isoform X2 [Papaver somniferum]RZC93492.1 hypothetical protein C5167_007305 [Papaver somniferum]